jgi:hypothetical protein
VISYGFIMTNQKENNCMCEKFEHEKGRENKRIGIF